MKGLAQPWLTPRSRGEREPGALPFAAPGLRSRAVVRVQLWGAAASCWSTARRRKWELYDHLPFQEEVASATKMAEAGESGIVTLAPSLELERAEEKTSYWFLTSPVNQHWRGTTLCWLKKINTWHKRKRRRKKLLFAVFLSCSVNFLMSLLHCLRVVTAPVPRSFFNTQLVTPLQSSWFSQPAFRFYPVNVPSSQNLLCHLGYLFAFLGSPFPIRQIVSQTSRSRFPGVTYWLCRFVCIMSSPRRRPPAQWRLSRDRSFILAPGEVAWAPSPLLSTL